MTKPFKNLISKMSPEAQERLKNTKADYVKSQPQTRAHTCHWPDCNKQVPPAMWGCKTHWFKLPKRLRDEIWLTYEPGQEVDMSPSSDYLDAADEVEKWILENG